MLLGARKGLNLICAAGLMMSLFAGCGSGGSQSQAGTDGDAPAPKSPEKTVASEPVTLKVQYFWLTDETFQSYIIDPVKKKYPNLTIEKYKVAPNKETDMEKMISDGTYPDLILTSSNLLDVPVKMGFTQDITALLKKNNFDLSRFASSSMEAVKAGGGGVLTGIPYLSNFSALYYNKDIFDKFGAPYPKDGMTWDETIDLAKKVTRTDGGVNYSGLHPDAVWRIGSQLGLGVIDSKTNKPIMNNDKWKKVLQTYQSVFAIPGNQFILGAPVQDGFYKDRTRAMYATNNQLGMLAAIPDFNWDMATYPEFAEAPATGMKYDMHMGLITPQGKHQDEALAVLAEMTSKEVQSLMSKTGTSPIINDDSVRKLFGQDLPFAKTKNLQAAFKTTPAVPAPASRWDSVVQNRLAVQSMKDLIENGKDINTVLREADEFAAKQIAADTK